MRKDIDLRHQVQSPLLIKSQIWGGPSITGRKKTRKIVEHDKKYEKDRSAATRRGRIAGGHDRADVHKILPQLRGRKYGSSGEGLNVGLKKGKAKEERIRQKQ